MVTTTEAGAAEVNATSLQSPATPAAPKAPTAKAKKSVVTSPQTEQPTGRTDKQPVRRQTSRPEYRLELMLNSVQAQRVFERSFHTIAYSLFSVDVVLRIMGEKPEVVSAVITIVDQRIAALKHLIEEEAKAMHAQAQACGLQVSPTYSQPAKVVAAISTPQAGVVASVVRRMDEMMNVMDMLWLNGELSTDTRLAEQHRWERRFYSLAGYLFNLQARAREEAKNRGKSDEVREHAPEMAPEQTASEVTQAAKLAAKQKDGIDLIPSGADADAKLEPMPA